MDADTLDDDDLDTILTVSSHGQSGRITAREVQLLVEVYRKWSADICPRCHLNQKRPVTAEDF